MEPAIIKESQTEPYIQERLEGCPPGPADPGPAEMDPTIPTECEKEVQPQQ